MTMHNQCDALEVMVANITDRLIIHVPTVVNNIDKIVNLYSKYSSQLRINIYVLLFHNRITYKVLNP
jgi:hypothetical protein